MNAIAWTVAQTRRLDLPCGAGDLLRLGALRAMRGPDAIERCALWVADTGRRVSWVDVSRQFDWQKHHAMKMLRRGVERGLLVRIAVYQSRRPDLFEASRALDSRAARREFAA